MERELQSYSKSIVKDDVDNVLDCGPEKHEFPSPKGFSATTMQQRFLHEVMRSASTDSSVSGALALVSVADARVKHGKTRRFETVVRTPRAYRRDASMYLSTLTRLARSDCCSGRWDHVPILAWALERRPPLHTPPRGLARLVGRGAPARLSGQDCGENAPIQHRHCAMGGALATLSEGQPPTSSLARFVRGVLLARLRDRRWSAQRGCPALCTRGSTHRRVSGEAIVLGETAMGCTIAAGCWTRKVRWSGAS